MSKTDTIGGWPSKKMRIASAAYVHAIGQINLTYNIVEEFFEMLFSIVLPADPKFSKRQFFSMNNRQRVDLFSELVRHNEKHRHTREALLYAAYCYDICTENRNIIAHSISGGVHEVTKKPRLSKRAAKDPLSSIEFHVSLRDLRRVAQQMYDCFWYSWHLYNTVGRTIRTARGEPISTAMLLAPFALPKRPRKPRKLIQYQPPATP